MAEIYEAAVVHCQNSEKRGRKYDDGLVYELAYKEYTKAERDPEFASTARSRLAATPSKYSDRNPFFIFNQFP